MLSVSRQDPLSRGIGILVALGSLVCVGASLLLWPPLGILLALLFGWVAALSSRRALAPLRRKLLELAIRGRGRKNPTVEQMTDLVEGVNQQVSGILGELRTERDELMNILEATHNGVLVVGADEHVERINDAAHRMLGTPVDAAGRHLSDITRNLDLIQLAQEVLAGEDSEARRIEIPAAQGSFSVHLTGHRVMGTEDQPRALLVLNDITHVKHLEQVRTDFVTNVTHEMRTPLASILGYAETLADDADELPSYAADATRRIARNARRLDNTIADLVKLSKLEHSEGPNPEEVDTEDFFNTLSERFGDLAHEKKIALEVDVKDAPQTLRVDQDLVEQAVSNLVENALKYSGADTVVSITASREGGNLRISVSDQGPGIPREHLGRIFERFYRVDRARSAAVGGTGLGLSIVKHAAALHGGRVRVDSEVGEGSNFHLLLPHSEELSEAETKPSGAA